MKVLRTFVHFGALFGTFFGLAGLIGLDPAVASEAGPADPIDWYDVGYGDGSQGLDPDRSPDVANDRDDYRRGWSDGIAGFCCYDSGFERGLAGEAASGMCPAILDAEFRRGWTEGRRLWRAEREIAELEDILVEQSRRLLEVGDVLTTTGQHLVRADADANERARWLEETKRLTTEQRDLAADIDSLEIDIRSRKEALVSLRFRLAGAG